MTRGQFKRGADADLTFTPEDGEPIHTNGATDTDKRLWVGDAADPKGTQVGWPFSPNPGRRSAWFYGTSMPVTAMNTATIAANIIAYSPIHLGSGLIAGDETIQGVVANVVGAQAAKNFRLGIYSNTNGTPGDLLAESGLISTATTGVKTWALSQSFVGGWYWLAFVTDATTATFRSNDNLAVTGGIMGHQSSNFQLVNVYYRVHAFAAFPAVGAITGAASLDNPSIQVQIA